MRPALAAIATMHSRRKDGSSLKDFSMTTSLEELAAGWRAGDACPRCFSVSRFQARQNGGCARRAFCSWQFSDIRLNRRRTLEPSS
jgi:hypothetical protein